MACFLTFCHKFISYINKQLLDFKGFLMSIICLLLVIDISITLYNEGFPFLILSAEGHAQGLYIRSRRQTQFSRAVESRPLTSSQAATTILHRFSLLKMAKAIRSPEIKFTKVGHSFAFGTEYKCIHFSVTIDTIYRNG